MTDPRLRVLSLGAGVQSTAMYLLADDGQLGPKPDVAIFADTQDERAATMRWLAKLEDVGSIPIVSATRGRLSTEVLRSMRESPSRFCPIPTYVRGEDQREKQGRRQCTRSHKLEPINQEVRRQAGYKRGQRSGENEAEVMVGISTDEAHRAKDSRYRISRNVFPLLFEKPMRRGDCAEYVRDRLGAVPPKSSCYYCPYRSDRDWIDMKRNDGEHFDKAVRFERAMRAIDPRQFLHDSCKPLDEAPLDESRNLDLFGNECEGMCGV